MTRGMFDWDDGEVAPAATFTEAAEVVTEVPTAPVCPVDQSPPEDDPLAAPTYASSESGAESDAESEDVDDQGDGGFSDQDGLVRVWLEDGRLVRNRISPIWFSKLARRDKLQNHFREALALALLDGAMQAEVAPDPEPPGPLAELAALPDEIRAAVDSLPPLSGELVAAIEEVADELEARTEVALAAQDASRSEPRTFVGRSQGASVTVDQWGNAIEVDFDERWLDRAQVGALVTHVQLAADRAHAEFVAHPEASEVDGLLEEQRMLSTLLTALLNPDTDAGRADR